MSKKTPVTEKYVDAVMGCIADGPDLLTAWRREHRKEGERSEPKHMLPKSKHGSTFSAQKRK
jgi:hypothetical protein